jgi:hypothetical protein
MTALFVESAAVSCGASGSDDKRGSEHDHQPTPLPHALSIS